MRVEPVEEWRRVALQGVWECRAAIEAAPSPIELWIELLDAFKRAHQPPHRPDFIRAVYDYALWSVTQAADPEVENAVGCAFLEHLPGNPAVRKQMPRYLIGAEFGILENALGNFLSEDERRALRSEFGAGRGDEPTPTE